LHGLCSVEEAIVHSKARIGDYVDDLKTIELWRAKGIEADFDAYSEDVNNPSPTFILFGYLMQEYFRKCKEIPTQVQVDQLIPKISVYKRPEGWISSLLFKTEAYSFETQSSTPFRTIGRSTRFVHFKALHEILRDSKDPKEQFESIRQMIKNSMLFTNSDHLPSFPNLESISESQQLVSETSTLLHSNLSLKHLNHPIQFSFLCEDSDSSQQKVSPHMAKIFLSIAQFSLYQSVVNYMDGS
jgi:hypothetical protein